MLYSLPRTLFILLALAIHSAPYCAGNGRLTSLRVWEDMCWALYESNISLNPIGGNPEKACIFQLTAINFLKISDYRISWQLPQVCMSTLCVCSISAAGWARTAVFAKTSLCLAPVDPHMGNCCFFSFYRATVLQKNVQDPTSKDIFLPVSYPFAPSLLFPLTLDGTWHPARAIFHTWKCDSAHEPDCIVPFGEIFLQLTGMIVKVLTLKLKLFFP